MPKQETTASILQEKVTTVEHVFLHCAQIHQTALLVGPSSGDVGDTPMFRALQNTGMINKILH